MGAKTRQPFSDRPDVVLEQHPGYEFNGMWLVHVGDRYVGHVSRGLSFRTRYRGWRPYLGSVCLQFDRVYPTLAAAAYEVIQAHERTPDTGVA